MTAPTPSRPTRTPAGEVDALMAALDHPGKDGIELLRQAILGIDPRIREEVKWNAPSFRLEDHFATFKLHPPMLRALGMANQSLQTLRGDTVGGRTG